MKDIPVFSTENGVASLTLSQIPYRREAYVRVQDSAVPEEFVPECAAFCRAAGAERVYAAGHPYLARFPLHTAVLELTCPRAALPETDAAAKPLTGERLRFFRETYNRAMADVPNAAFLTEADAEALLRRGGAYEIVRGETLLGIGCAAGDRITAVAALQPHAGAAVVAALASTLEAPLLRLTVASANEKAVRLYRRLGFSVAEEVSRWYRVAP